MNESIPDETPEKHLLAIQPDDPQEDDSLMDELLAANPEFQALAAKSKATPRKPFSMSAGE